MKQQIIIGSKYRWHVPSTPVNEAQKLCSELSMSYPIAQVLINRGYTDSTTLQSFLFPSYQRDVAPAQSLKGAQAAVGRILDALIKKEKILIVGDYDVDGITSTSLFLVCLLPLGAHINYFLPHRVKDGYGLSKKIVQRAARSGYTLIITVDNGITSYEAAEYAHAEKIDLIITDHHRPHDKLPRAHTIVNPHQKGCAFPHKILAGVGVTFKIVSLLYELKGMSLPDKAYELMMLGTIADVVPLVQENRYWVQYGLAQVNKKRSFALNVLAHNGKITKGNLTSLDIGFMIAPQLNALGRLDDSRDAVKFLISTSKEDVTRIGMLLHEINTKRKAIDRTIFEHIQGAIEEDQIKLSLERLILAAHHTWPPGVIGLVAGKLTHSYGRPAILLHLSDNGIAKGSCRSIPEFNIFNALKKHKELLTSFGGHSLAAGLALHQKNIPLLKERLEENLAALFSINELHPKLTIDAELTLPEMTKKIIKDLATLEPFGNQNPQPTFIIRNVQLQKEPTLLKGAHVKCFIFSEGVIKPLIFFNRPDLYSLLREHGEKPFDLAGVVTQNEWMGTTSIELQGMDVAL